MKSIQIVCYERGWIVDAIARQWLSQLSENQSEFEVKLCYHLPEPGADIYVHFIYFTAIIVPNRINVVCVTHIDHWWKAFKIIQLARLKVNFIAMSTHTRDVINDYTNSSNAMHYIPRSIHFNRFEVKLFKKLVFGLFFKFHEDGRKNDAAINKLCNVASRNNKYCKLILFGKGFNRLVALHKNLVAEINENEFDILEYKKTLNKCDYVVYFGYDEGAISILDAATLGIPVLATKQGYHLDIDLPRGSMLCNTSDEIVSIIESLCSAITDSPKDDSLLTIFRNMSTYTKTPSFSAYVNVFTVKNDFIKKTKHIKNDIKFFIKNTFNRFMHLW